MNNHTQKWVTPLVRLSTSFLFCAALFLSPVSGKGAQSAKALYDQIVTVDESYSACTSLAMSCGQSDKNNCKALSCNTGNAFLGGDSRDRDALTTQLKAQYLAGDLTAAFYWGYINWSDGGKISEPSSKILQDYQKEKYQEAYAGFLRASEGGVGAASWNIAVMYEQGNGLTRSRLAAAEWYAKAGHQHLKNGNREQSLAALERIEEIDAKHRDALSLRAALFPRSRWK